MKKLLFIYAISFVVFPSISQDKSPWTEEGVRKIANSGSEQNILMDCSMLMQEEYFYYAEILANRLLEIKPNSCNYNYRKGYLELEVNRDYNKAIPKLEIAVQDVDPSYDMYSINEKSAPVDAYYHLARCYHYNSELEKAKEFFDKFLASSNKKSELLPDAKLKSQQLDVAITLMKNPVNCRLVNLKDINTQYPDYSPFVSFDGTALYFTSRRPWENKEDASTRDPKINQFTEDVYISYLNFDSTWTKPSRLSFCRQNRNEASVSLSTDEKKIYLYEDSTGNGDIYYSDFYNNRFNEIKRLDDKLINGQSWETHAMVYRDGSAIIFSSDRPGGYGGRDLYISKRDGNSWGEPTNLGPLINGPMDEDGPFISVNNKQLYFGTNDNRSMGGFDIMISEIDNNGNWGAPKNIGYPFNSTNDDLFYTTTVDGFTGYLTSYRSGGKGEKDIYEIHNDFLGVKDISVLKGEVVTTDGSLLPDNMIFVAKIKCLDCEGKPTHLAYTRDRDGKFMSGLRSCKTYTLTYHDATDDKLMGEETFKTECDNKYHEIYKKLIIDTEKRIVIFPKDSIEEIPDVVVVDYPNIELKHYFDYNKNKLSVKRGELKRFVKTIDKQIKDGREKVTITVESSASHVPTSTFKSNEELTQVRADNMKYDLTNYFEKHKKTNGKVMVIVSKTIVQGPEYENDSENHEKYRPYQYVYIKTE